MDRRQLYALTHPLDEYHMHRLANCRRTRVLPDGAILMTVLAVDR